MNKTDKTFRIFSAIIIIILLGIITYLKLNPQEKIVQIEMKASVLTRIAECESANRQTGKDGQLLINVNSDKSVDIGVFQINNVWNATATKMGLDLSKEQDNRTFALWLFKNKGSGSWSSSSKCWSN